MTTKQKKATGSARMRQLDYLPVQVWFKRERLNRISRCATKKGKALAEFIREAAEKEAALTVEPEKYR